MFENKVKTELSELGEFGLIRHLGSKFNPARNTTIKGIGDDAAVIAAGQEVTLLTTDLLLEGYSFQSYLCAFEASRL